MVSLIGASLAVSTPATAQLCGGAASFAQRPWQLSAAAAFNKDGNSFAGGLGVGGSGPFVQLTAAKTSYDQFDGSPSVDLGAGAGWQIAADPESVFRFCPLVSFVHASGPDSVLVGTQRVNLSQDAIAVGMSLGAVALRKSGTQIIPFASVAWVNVKLKSTNAVSAQAQSTTTSEALGLVELGVGVLFGQAFSIRPHVGLTFGLNASSTTYGASMSVNFGRRSTRP